MYDNRQSRRCNESIDFQFLLQKICCHVERGFQISNSTLSAIAEIICPEITRPYHIFPFYKRKNEDIPNTVFVSHLFSHNCKIQSFWPIAPQWQILCLKEGMLDPSLLYIAWPLSYTQT